MLLRKIKCAPGSVSPASLAGKVIYFIVLGQWEMCEEWQQLLNGVKGKWTKIPEHFQVCVHRYALLLVLS